MKSSTKAYASSEHTRTSSDEAPQDMYKVLVSIRFIAVSMSCSILLAFAVGRAARIFLLEGPRKAMSAPRGESSIFNRPDFHEDFETRHAKTLPPPRVQPGRQVPHTIYTAKNFDTARSATSSSLLVRGSENDDANNDEVCDGSAPVANEADDGEHLPAGQHLLVDIEGVDGSFLNSEERLAFAMVEVVNQAELTLLSYHCHSMIPTGVSCVGVLLESHVSFHTWPGQGVITLDLFTCGPNTLLPVVPIIERLFGVPRPGADHPPHTIWAHKLRGFRPDGHNSPLQKYDLGTSVLGVMTTDYKQEIASVKTKFQRVDIYDVIYTRFNNLKRYKKSMSNDGSYESRNSELFMPDRMLMLDGVLQSRSKGEEAYHEALVHPVMFSHDNPKRVAIIGGGEGATLREVLKHNTVETAIMVEIDEIMVQVSKQYLPTWSDCSDIVGSTTSCFEDPRADVYYEDAIGWFLHRYGNDGEKAEPLDVIIMDALDPQDEIEFADALYTYDNFVGTLHTALADDGVLVIQVGSAPGLNDPVESLTSHKNRDIMIGHLEKLGFESIHIYDESHAGFFSVWNFVVATKKRSARKLWYRNEAEIELAIRNRMLRTKSGRSSLRHFDGSTMLTYQRPSKRTEALFCRREPTPIECTLESMGFGFDPHRPNTDLSNFEVRLSEASENAGRGVFAKVDIPIGNYIAVEHSVHGVYFPPYTYDLISETSFFLEESLGKSDLRMFEFYMSGYGFSRQYHGEHEVVVDSSIMTFVNHGCNGTNNVGLVSEITELTADLNFMPEEFVAKGHSTLYNPAADRHLPHYIAGAEISFRPIRAGDEILDNYLAFIAVPSFWMDDVEDLRSQCSGLDYLDTNSDVRKIEDWYKKRI